MVKINPNCRTFRYKFSDYTIEFSRPELNQSKASRLLHRLEIVVRIKLSG